MSLTKAELAACLQDELGISQAECKEFVDHFFGAMVDALARGEEVKLSGFGRFSLRDKNARPGRNPKTGEEVLIAARRVVTFNTGPTLRARLIKAS
ncbi:MAG: integration host factor subunit alpha [Acidihalobacter sp.]|jgi:integration host factor subunit alpha